MTDWYIKQHGIDLSIWYLIVASDPLFSGRGHKRTGSHGNSPLSGTPCATPTLGRSQMASTSVDNLLFDRHDNDRNVNFSAVLPNGGISSEWGRRADKIDGLIQERRNSSVFAMELRLSCINPL